MSVLNPASGWLAAAMVAAVIGHCFPVWLKFRGGKGVASALGSFLVLSPFAALAGVGVWLLVLVVGRRVSLASMTAAAAFPVLLVVLDDPSPVILATVSAVSILIIVLHGSNIRRLIDGSEPKIGGWGGA
jgi:glycerol-3-phosphate acyltransferase PlsY